MKNHPSNRRATEAGAAGEARVARILNGIPDSILLTNLLVPRPGGTAEVDALLITGHGLYAVEAKNYSAASSITGSLVRYEWTQTLRRKGQEPFKRKVYNPIRQNRAHILALCRFLRAKGVDVREPCFHSLVVFSPNCTLKKVPPNEASFTIIQEPMLRSFLQRRQRVRRERFTTAEMRTIARALETTIGASEARRNAHTRDAKRAERKRLAERAKRRKAEQRRRRRRRT